MPKRGSLEEYEQCLTRHDDGSSNPNDNYDRPIGGFHLDEDYNNDYDRPIGGFHNDYDNNSSDDDFDDGGIKHFQD